MTRAASAILLSLWATVMVLVVLSRHGCNDNATPSNADSVIQRLTIENNILKEAVSRRDTILERSHDTVVYRIREVHETIRDYRLVHDTLLKLQICDSLVEDCETLAAECEENDSLHRAQEKDLKKIISKQDTIITVQATEIVSLKKKRNMWKAATAATAAALTAILIVR